MKTPVLILLLLLMLAPRLSAALPHALACADQRGTATASMDAAAAGHDHHRMIAEHANAGGHHGEHNSPSGIDDASNKGDATANDDGSCQHCGQCDEHCSALLIASSARQTTVRISEMLTMTSGQQRAGFSHDLNRPPRSLSL